MASIESLKALNHLSELDLSLNPVVDTENYRLRMIVMLPQLRKLDEQDITEAEQLAAVEFRQQQEEIAAAAAAAAVAEDEN